ncbi:MAG: aminopeptidase [Actinomycetota bacterium]|nr:aminopeptidase [Actinomycetota bacterium]
MDATNTKRLADLAVSFGANVQPGQIVAVEAETGMEPLVRALASRAYEKGARFVDATYFDPYVKRARLEHAELETLGYVPPWYGQRMLELGEHRAARIVAVPRVSPGILNGVDPERAGRDELPDLPERLVVANEQKVNWTAIPYPTASWAEVVYPDLAPTDALERLTADLLNVCRLDEDDPTEAWRAWAAALRTQANRLNDRRFDAIRFTGEGTDLTIGLLPTSKWDAALMETRDGIVHLPNIPTEEIFSAPDPQRADGVVRATKPLELGGAVIRGLTVRFEGGRAVEIDADENAEVLRGRAGHDEGAARLGEIALVDREGRIGALGTTFYNTLLDENAASHIALGSAYEISVAEEDRPRLNSSAIHIDFMIGGDDVQVSGLTAEGDEVPVLEDGTWQI